MEDFDEAIGLRPLTKLYDRKKSGWRLTFVKKESTRTFAVCLSGKRWVRRKFLGRLITFSTIICLLGSMVKGDGPAMLSMIIRTNWRKDNVPESPIYTIYSYQ